MADSDVGLQLLPTKRLKMVDLRKCIVCQNDSPDVLRQATDAGRAVFWAAAEHRNDEVYHRILPILDSLPSSDILWHSNCYKCYTSKRNLSFVKQHSRSNVSEEMDPESTSVETRSSRSTVSSIDWSLCLFCQKKKHKGCKDLINVCTFDACEAIKNAAESRGDHKMIVNIGDVDLIAAEAKYHGACRANYVSKSNLKFHQFKEEGKEEDAYAHAFQQLVEEISPNISAGKAYDMVSLLSSYQLILERSNVSTSASYRSEKLKRRLQHHFKDSIVFQKQADPSKPELVYSSQISLQAIINEAAKQRSKQLEEYLPVSNADDVKDDRIKILYHAAQILKSDMKHSKGIKIQPLCIEDVSLSKAKYLIPETLYSFLCWIIAQPEKIGENGTVAPSCQDPEDERRVLMLGQDMVHAVTRGRVKTPKHVGLAVTLHHITGSKQIVTLLNRMGHCISYDDVEVVDTSLAQEIITKSEESGVVIPSNISPGVFVQCAGDNNDVNEETLDGKETTHATTLVVYQRRQFGPKAIPVVQGDHPVRKRALDVSIPSQDILECSVGGKRPPVTAFIGEAKEEWYRCPFNLQSAIERKDLAWFLLRRNSNSLLSTDPCQQKQTIPGWSAFNAAVSSVKPVLSTIGYCPMISGSPTEFSTVYTVLKICQAMTASLAQTNSVITFDLAIYMKAKELQWRFVDEFKETVIRMGGFHIALNYLAVIGKKFQDSGLEDLLTESGVYGNNTTLALLKGKSYNRSVRAHKILMEALLRLQWQAFITHTSGTLTASSLETLNEDELCTALSKCRATSSSKQEMAQSFDILCGMVTNVQTSFSQFKMKACMKSQMFKFWNSYIDMVLILLRFIRAERDGNWPLHLAATADMVPHFFSMDRTNYSRWLPVYLADMQKLHETAPEVYQEFMQGNHPVSRSGQPFSQVWTDMALEQSINLDSKTRGGIIGITQKPGTLERWFLTAHERAAITSATKGMCSISDSDRVGTHKEGGQKRVHRDEEDVQKLLTTIKERMANPFEIESSADDGSIPLTNLATGVVMPPEAAVRLVNLESIGRQHLETFIKSRINSNEVSFWEPLTRLNIKTFASLSKKTQAKSTDERMITVAADRDLFARLLIAANSRDIDLREVLSYELSTVPCSLAHNDGTLRKCTKAHLLSELEREADVQPRLPLENDTLPTAYVIDGMAIVQAAKSAGARTFGELASKYFKVITAPLSKDNCSRVDVVFDRYDKPDSIKGGERARRGTSSGFEVKISGPHTPIPKQWQKYINNPKNKAMLQVFLSESWSALAQSSLIAGQQLVIGGGFEAPKDARLVIRGHQCSLQPVESDHEEADTRLLLHAKNASCDHRRIVVQSPDTDVAVLCVYAFRSLQCEQLWFRTGVKDKLRYVPIHQVVDKLGPDLCKVLPAFHSLTGCDTTSGLSRIGKKKAWKVMKNSPDLYPGMMRLGEEIPPSNDAILSCERFLCATYTTSPKAGSTVDEVRYWMFCQRKQKNEGLPPTSNSLHHHIERVNYQTMVWKRCMEAVQGLPSPDGNGWIKTETGLEPVLMSKDPAPKGLLELTICRCHGKSA